MKVYVETNFIIEMAYHQEQHDCCRSIIQLCAKHGVDLVLPSFCVSESYYELVGKRDSRERLIESMNTESDWLAQSSGVEEKRDSIREAVLALEKRSVIEKRNFASDLLEVLQVATLIPLTEQTVREAMSYETTLGLEEQDAVVYASVISDLRATTQGLDRSLFVTKNTNHFLTLPDIKKELHGFNCRILGNFKDCLDFMNHEFPE